MSIRVLVTGAASAVGQGIVKSLRASSEATTIIGADIHPLSSALFRTDEAVLIPKVEDPGSLSEIMSVLKRARARVLMIGSEFEVEFFAEHKEEIERETNTFIVVSPLAAVRIADDKWLTAEFLRANGLPHATSFVPADLDAALAQALSWGFPLVLKARSGTSNRHVHVIKTEGELRTLFPRTPKPMLQHLIDFPRDELRNEYTCSIFKCRDGSLLGPFTARRILRGGSSWIVEVAPFPALFPLIAEIGRRLPILGSLNVQLMVGDSGPVPFEFNCRFSGTTAVRAHFGFNEPEMTIRSFVLGQPVSQPIVRRGLALRYLEEVFVEGFSADELQFPLPVGHVRPWF